jgi:hypothetical protein
VNVNGKAYAIPFKALEGCDGAYVQRAIGSGLELLSEIQKADTFLLENNSPINSRQKMADLIWALDAKAWEIDSSYQLGSGAMDVSDEENKKYTALKGANDASGNSFVCSRKGRSSHLEPFKSGKDSQFGFDPITLVR